MLPRGETRNFWIRDKPRSEHLRLVRFFDEEQGREFMFLTNAMELTALQVADLYKNRWQIELFFKWLKQHLKIKKFWGTTENAVRIQIYSAICAYTQRILEISSTKLYSKMTKTEAVQVNLIYLIFNSSIF